MLGTFEISTKSPTPYLTSAEIATGPMKGDDEPIYFDWRVLEGVTEPVTEREEDNLPEWLKLKNLALI